MKFSSIYCSGAGGNTVTQTNKMKKDTNFLFGVALWR